VHHVGLKEPQNVIRQGRRDWSAPADPGYQLEEPGFLPSKNRDEATGLSTLVNPRILRRSSSTDNSDAQPPAPVVSSRVMRRPSKPDEGSTDHQEISGRQSFPLEQSSSRDEESVEEDKGGEAEPKRESVTLPLGGADEPVWQDPIDVMGTEDEKEKRRQALALEQQQLVLRQVEAARAKRHSSKRQIEKKEPPTRSHKVPMEDEKQKAERQEHQQSRGPRTKGMLFRRLADGSLVQTDRFGEPLPKEESNKELSMEEASDTPPKEADTPNEAPGAKAEKPFVPAPIPKVSAWTLGPPASIFGPGENEYSSSGVGADSSRSKTQSVSNAEPSGPVDQGKGEPTTTTTGKPRQAQKPKDTRPQTKKETNCKKFDSKAKQEGRDGNKHQGRGRTKKPRTAPKRKPRKQQVAASTEGS